MRKLVLFDFDGTLVDSAPDLANAANLQRIKQGLAPLDYAPLRAVASTGARGLLKVALNLDSSDEQYESVRLAFLNDYKAACTKNTVLFEGIDTLLSTLESHGFQWGIVTNKASDLSEPMFKHFQFDTRSATNVCGDTTPFPKPNPAPLLYAAEQAGFDCHDSIYIGDDQRDITAGKAANMKTIAVGYGYSDTPEEALSWGADLCVMHVSQLWDAIKQLSA